jgi:methylated-DNA-[protein]-cysteine S-methyltransferase
MALPPLFSLHWNSPVGDLLLVADAVALRGVWFADQKGIPAAALQAPEAPDHDLLCTARRQLEEYFSGQRKRFDVPMQAWGGTAFQHSVWQALHTIPFGHTTTYGALAAQLGRPRAVRALGGAVGRNPLGIVWPCHRVVGANGALTGYTGGLDRKIALLRHEQSLAG